MSGRQKAHGMQETHEESEVGEMSPSIPLCWRSDATGATRSQDTNIRYGFKTQYVQSLVEQKLYNVAAWEVRQIIDGYLGPAPEWIQVLNLVEELARRYERRG